MDRLTKAFVITASGVVIAVGGVWLNQQYAAHQARERCIGREINSLKDTFGWIGPNWTKLEKRQHVQRIGRCLD
jgi:hypothetical protein